MIQKLLTLSFMLIGLNLCAQQNENYNVELNSKHYNGNRSAEFQAGGTARGMYYQLSVHSYQSDKNIISAAYNMEIGKVGLTNLKYNSIKFYYNRTLFNIKETVFFSVMGGAVLGLINANNKEFKIQKNTLYYGMFAGGNLEYFPLKKYPRISVVVSVEQQYNFRDFFGNFKAEAGLGLRYMFN